MNKSIGIVGAGVGGLHLALYLQKHGIEPVVLTDRKPDDYASMRLMNTVAHHYVTIDRENELDVNHWDDPDLVYHHHDHFFNFPDNPLLFRGAFRKSSRAVDYRIYLPALMQDFVERGGGIEYADVHEDGIPGLLERFDLLVSNPPYVDPGERERLSPEVVDFEPGAALFAPGSGRSVIERLLASAGALRPGTPLVIEIGYDQSEWLRSSVAGGRDLVVRDVVRDYAGIPRTAVLERI